MATQNVASVVSLFFIDQLISKGVKLLVSLSLALLNRKILSASTSVHVLNSCGAVDLRVNVFAKNELLVAGVKPIKRECGMVDARRAAETFLFCEIAAL